jgi:hypothetical protein
MAAAGVTGEFYIFLLTAINRLIIIFRIISGHGKRPDILASRVFRLFYDPLSNKDRG